MKRGKKRGPNGAGTLYKEPGRGWRSEAYVTLPDGRRRRVKGRGATAEQAVIARVEAGKALISANPETDLITVKQLSERWFEARSPQWAPSTIASYRTALDLHIVPEIGDARVVRLRSLDAQRVLDRVMRTSKGKHVAVANRCRRVMHALFAQAKRWGIVSANPAAGLEPIRASKQEAGWWTPTQVEAFLVTAERSPYHDFFHAALVTGLRSGELIALRWRDFDGARFWVRRTYSQHAPGRVQEHPKSASSVRRVTVPRALADRLIGRRGEADELVFASRAGRMLNPSNVRRALRVYAARAEVPLIKVHALRRTYASILAGAGHHPSVIQKLLGHASPELALRVYTSVSDSQAEGVVVDLGGYVWGSRSGSMRPGAGKSSAGGSVEVALDTVN